MRIFLFVAYSIKIIFSTGFVNYYAWQKPSLPVDTLRNTSVNIRTTNVHRNYVHYSAVPVYLFYDTLYCNCVFERVILYGQENIQIRDYQTPSK